MQGGGGGGGLGWGSNPKMSNVDSSKFGDCCRAFGPQQYARWYLMFALNI